MTIDTTRPWFPQDYPLEDVLALVKRIPIEGDAEYARRLAKVERDYNIRKGGVAGIFNDLRISILSNLGKADADGNVTINMATFSKMIQHDVADAIYKLEGNSIPDTKFVIQEYAAPVLRRDEAPDYSCTPTLIEETRPATAPNNSIADQYWDLVNS